MRQLTLLNLAPVQRLRIATASALVVHVLVFGAGWWLIERISIPADHNRAMLLTLESTPIDGLQAATPTYESTLANALKGPASSFLDTQTTQDLSQKNTQTQAEQPATTTAESIVEANSNLSPLNAVSVEASLGAEHADPPPSPRLHPHEQTPATDKVHTATQPVENESELIDAVALQDSPMSVPIAQRVEISGSETPSKVSPKQQSMIERKVQKWAQRHANNEALEPSFSWRHRGQVYTANLSLSPAGGPMDLDEMRVDVSTVKEGQAVSTTLKLKKLAFSNFAQFVHRWDPQVMIHDDRMDGRFHSNSQIMLSSDKLTRPVFHGKVTTASHRVEFDQGVRRSTRREIFQGGLETGVQQIVMPRPQMSFTETKPDSSSDTILFETDTRLVFTREGGLMWHPTEEASAPSYRALPPHPVYLIANKGVTLSVSGDVLGKVMVYSPKRIIIEDDLRYARADFQQNEDMIGLISGQDIVIAGQELTGEGDLTVQGSIYAKGRFLVRNYRAPHTGTLNIYGSVSAGTLGATQPRYATHIQFDPRFENLRPPGFPMTERYEVTNPEPVWNATLQIDDLPQIDDRDKPLSGH